MSEVKTPPVTATVIADRGEAEILGHPAGTIQFFDAIGHSPRGFHFVCPCGCGAIGGVTVAGDGCWEWNGSRDKPTVRPSVRLGDKRGSHWHGFLTDGVWSSC